MLFNSFIYAASLFVASWLILFLFFSKRNCSFFSGRSNMNRNLEKDCEQKRQHRTVLFVTAHPDDEAMFYVPTIAALKEQGFKLHLLCLSIGDFVKRGDESRVKELRNCWNLLAGSQGSLKIINDKNLLDGPKEIWESDRIRKYVVEEIDSLGGIENVEAFVTFDSMGISGHPNHIAVFRAMQKFHQEQKTAGNKVFPAVFSLRSVPLVPKYLGPLSAVAYSIASKLAEAKTPKKTRVVFVNVDSKLVWSAMKAHASQFVWFRKLFVVFSLYSFFNELEQVE